MKQRHPLVLFMILLLSVACVTKAEAAPWKRNRHYSRPVMRYADGCRSYCKEYDGCKRCFRHTGHANRYVTK